MSEGASARPKDADLYLAAGGAKMTENHKPALVAIGKAIRGLREERGMSVEALATAAQTSVGKLEAIEDGRDDLRFDVFVRLGEGLDTKLAAITGRAEKATRETTDVNASDD
jgi:transcriptional regulator with XRE-family HTH domain